MRKTFEITCPFGREPRLDDIRVMAAQALRLRRGAVVNVIDPTKSYQPTMVGAEAHCHIIRRSIDARGDVKVASVNTARIQGKIKRQGRTQGRRPERKKAFVQLKEDSKAIEFFESMAQ